MKKPIKKIKSSMLSRSLSLAKLGVSTSAKLATHSLKSLGADAEKKSQLWNKFLKLEAAKISSELGQLKGSLMKAGQTLSMYGEHFLPPEANAFLKSLQTDSPPMSWEVIEPVLKSRMSEDLIQQIDVDENPLGSASLGQAHRAKVSSTGDEIVLKIQYPGVERAISSDLRAIRSFLSVTKILPKNLQTDGLFTEVHEMLTQETNYTQEMRETQAYADRLEGDRRYIVPKVFPDFSGPKILATSYEAGLSPDDPLILALSQARRNRLSENFFELYLLELFQWGTVQTDPHFGNYRIRLSPDGQDRLVLLDFGAVRTYPKSFLRPYALMIQAALEKDRAKLEQAAQELSFLADSDSSTIKSIFIEFCELSVEPFMGQVYDFGKSDLPQRLTMKVMKLLQQFHIKSPPREVLFLDRKTGGVFIFLKVLGAQLNARELLLKHLSQSPWLQN